MSTASTGPRPRASAYGFRLSGVGQLLQRCDLGTLQAGSGEVVIEVAGCGICHTDVGFARQGVPTRKPLPIVLGHEIVGRVVEAGADASEWLGRQVIVPAVIPCGKCPACAAGRPTICSAQFMPGNDGDGGFATHVRVPARGLCPVPDHLPQGVSLPQLAVVADAVTTPWEAMRRAAVGDDNVAVIVGAGGIGGFAVQIAAALGAAVVAIDIDDARLQLAAQHGASLTLNSKSADEKQLKSAVRAFAKQSGRRGIGLKVFEMSGTAAGQATAFSLLDFGGYLAVVGFTPDKVQVRLSNLMALDAMARGNWGCPPDQYPAALKLVLDGKVALEPYVEMHPLSDAATVFEAVVNHELKRRAVLVP